MRAARHGAAPLILLGLTICAASARAEPGGAPRPAFAAPATASPRIDAGGPTSFDRPTGSSSAPAKTGGDKKGAGKKPGDAAPSPADKPRAESGPEGARPSRLTLTLHRLHGRIAAGDETALTAQGALVADLERQFAAVDPSVWATRREAAAQMTLLLSGGDPRAARRRFAAGLFGANADLVAAGLAFAEGDAAAARRRLAELEAAQVDEAGRGAPPPKSAAAAKAEAAPKPDLGVDALTRAQAALVAATLATAGPEPDAAQADRLFDRARLEAPGTLTEETALRRQARFAETRGDAARFAELAGQHLRRFPRSAYAGAFRGLAPEAAARLAIRARLDDLTALEPLLLAQSAEERARTLDAVARAGLAQGRFGLALAAARRTLETTPGLTDPWRRAATFALIAGAMDGGADVLTRLEAAPAPDPESAALKRTALDFLGALYAWPPLGDAPPEERPPPSEGARRAEDALEAGDALLAPRGARLAAATTAAPPQAGAP